MKTLKTILIIALTWAAATVCQAASTADTNQLANSIEESLTNHFPNVDQMKIGQESQKIAEQYIAVATNSDLLYRGLTNAFSTNTVLNLGTNDAAINRAAAAVINKEDFGIVPMSMLQSNAPSLPYMAFLSVGAEFLNPWQIDSSTRTLTNNESSTSAYLQFDYINRFILRDTEKELAYQNQWEGDKILGGHFVNPFKTWPDIQAQIGFVFDSGSSPTNYSASALAGNGDFYDEGSVGLPIWRQLSRNMCQQVSIEASGGFVTEKVFERLHPNMFFGMGYETSFVPRIGFSSTNMPGFLLGRVGAGWVDTPHFDSGTNTVTFNPNTDEPKFEWNVHPSMQVYLAYPLTQNIYFTVEANAYFAESPPDSWNVKIGASIPLDNVTKLFSSFLGN